MKGTKPAINEEMQTMVRDLVVDIHRRDSNTQHSMLVFLPTYKALERQWLLLHALPHLSIPLQVYVLHSSIETDACIRTMEAAPSNRRKIILATNIAESSVTMRGVKYVVDCCLSLVLAWDPPSQRHYPHLVWASHSQLDQRKGRTGRTCDGVVYRMLPRGMYAELAGYEVPAVKMLSLRKQALVLACAQSKVLQDPHFIFGHCLDPPEDSRVSDAIQFLTTIGALSASAPPTSSSSSSLLSHKLHPHHKSSPTFTPTDYGRLLVSLPLSLEASMVLVRGAQEGMLWEAALLAAMMDSSPFPIAQPFGRVSEHHRFLRKFVCVSEEEEFSPGYVSSIIANVSSFLFWQYFFKDKIRLARIFVGREGEETSREDMEKEDEEEREFCSHHHLLQSSLHSIYETVYVSLEAVHRLRPNFLTRTSLCAEEDALPTPFSYPSPLDVIAPRREVPQHKCVLVSPPQPSNVADVSGLSELLDALSVDRQVSQWECASVPFVARGPLISRRTKAMLERLIQAARGDIAKVEAWQDSQEEALPELIAADRHRKDDAGRNNGPVEPSQSLFSSQGQSNDTYQLNFGRPVCTFFLRGSCTRGKFCHFLHSTSAPKPFCDYFLSPQGCRYGQSCPFRHTISSSTPSTSSKTEPKRSSSQVKFLSNELDGGDKRRGEPPSDLISIFIPTSTQVLPSTEVVLLVGDGDFSFARWFMETIPSRNFQVVATSPDSQAEASRKHPIVLSANVSAIASSGAKVLFGVDFSVAPAVSGFSGQIFDQRWRGEVARMSWIPVRKVLWSFPFSSSKPEESLQAQRKRVAEFFLSLSRPFLKESTSETFSCEVIITLCNDQFSRCQVERAAREHFFTLVKAVPFDFRTISHNQHARNASSPLLLKVAIERPMSYIFRFCIPRHLLLST